MAAPVSKPHAPGQPAGSLEISRSCARVVPARAGRVPGPVVDGGRRRLARNAGRGRKREHRAEVGCEARDRYRLACAFVLCALVAPVRSAHAESIAVYSIEDSRAKGGFDEDALEDL